MGQSEDASGSTPDDEMREWIRTNMVAEGGSILRDLRERVARVVTLNDDGIARLRPGVSLPTREVVLSSYVGRHYAVAAGLAPDPSIENKEIAAGLSIPKGTVGRCVKELRDARLIKVVSEGRHTLPLSNLDRAVLELERRAVNGERTRLLTRE